MTYDLDTGLRRYDRGWGLGRCEVSKHRSPRRRPGSSSWGSALGDGHGSDLSGCAVTYDLDTGLRRYDRGEQLANYHPVTPAEAGVQFVGL